MRNLSCGKLVELVTTRDPHAVEAEHRGQLVEVMVVVQDVESVLGRYRCHKNIPVTDAVSRGAARRRRLRQVT